eukprot:GILK01006911.1.p1 GENE.GILK01006911.1~~GILK01006911.1.p1  ORF type:complete len:233 (-),score=26.58 GILK01006911.1:341-1039(-)
MSVDLSHQQLTSCSQVHQAASLLLQSCQTTFKDVTHINLTRNFLSEPEWRAFCEAVELSNLRVLFLTANELLEVPDFSSFRHLRELHLNNNRILNLRNLECLTSLEVLDIRSNRIKSLAGLSGNTNLVSLAASCNLIDTLDGMPLLPRLTYFSLFGNQIGIGATEYDTVVDNLVHILSRCIPHVEAIYLGGNPATTGASGLRCKTLCIRTFSKLDHYDNQYISSFERRSALQ